MDEENVGFPIPANGPEIGAETAGDFIVSFGNEAGDRAVVLTTVEVLGDEVLERHPVAELEGYAMDLLDGGEDTMDLMIGDIYEGENAAADADAEAMRLNDMYDPGADATDEDLVMAVNDAKADTGPEETFPEDLGEGEDLGASELDLGLEAPEEEPEIGGPAGGVENEPMLGQLMKKKPRA